MIEKEKKVVIVGIGEFGEIAYEYFTHDSTYEVVGFAVERRYKDKDELFGLPVVEFETIENIFSNLEVELFVAITYVKLNRARKRIYDICKKKGYVCASYVSSHAFVWHNVKIGENVFIFENNTIQHYAEIGDNTVLWSGNHIGHRSKIGSDCWLTSHVVISGFCNVGSGSFIGVNATLGDNVTIGEDTVFGAGALTVKNLEEKGCVYVGVPAHKTGKTSYEQFEVMEVIQE